MTATRASNQDQPDHSTTRSLITIGTRIFSSHLLAIAAGIALVSFALLSLFRSYFLDALEDSLLIQADLIARAILPEVDSLTTEPTLPAAFNTLQQQQVDQLSVQIQNQATSNDQESIPQVLAALEQADIAVTTALQTEIYIFDRELEVLLAPVNSGSQLSALRDSAQHALEGSESREIISGVDSDNLIVATPLLINGEIIAAILLSHPLGDLQAVFQSLWLRLGASASLSLVITSIISLLFTRSIQKPILQLRTASEHLQDGDYNYPVPYGRSDELGELSRAFDAMRKQLRSTERLRTRFLSDVAHELRTPLTSIKGLTETLQDGAVEDVQVRDRFLASIDRETDRLIRLTRDLLELTRVDAQGIALHKSLADINTLIAEVLAQFDVEADRKSIQFELANNCPGVQLSLDRDRIGQVLINLIDNALRYAPEGSEIGLEIDCGTQEDIPAISILDLQHERGDPEQAGKWLMVSIVDHGPGIPKADLERVFDRFYRVERARDRARGGSGLGLPIAQAIVAAHAGYIWAESPAKEPAAQRNPGTRITFALPVQTP